MSFAQSKTAGSDWTFTDQVAFLLPQDWRILSQSSEPTIGSEILIGKREDYYARLFISGDKMKLSEFKIRMGQIMAHKKNDPKTVLIGQPALVPYLKTGLRMDLRYENTLKGKLYFEIHAPFVVNGQGMDVYFVAPKSSYPTASKEFEYLLDHLSPYWIPQHQIKPTTTPKTTK